MGSASSKAARISAARSGKKPSWSGARSPAYDPKTLSTPLRARQAWASESKDEEIQRDAKDPQLLANLSRLKPVHVHHHTLQMGTEARQDQAVVVKKLFESRARAEDDAASARTPRNRLHVSSLVALLKERQNLVIGGGGDGGAMAVAAAAAAEQLGEKYGMDVERLQRLVRSVNVPSVREGGGGVGSVRRYVKDAESGEDMVVTEVAWKEPTVLREDLQVRPSSSRTGSA